MLVADDPGLLTAITCVAAFSSTLSMSLAEGKHMPPLRREFHTLLKDPCVPKPVEQDAACTRWTSASSVI
jgi:hypothetical protein